MKIGLAQVDGKWPNLALMKLSAWHKKQGDTVGWFSPLEGWDSVLASKIFAFTPDDPYLPPDTIKGGTGYDIKSELSPAEERCRPDYSLYPSFDSAMGFTTRGCIRKCPFCLVPEKEGNLQIVAQLGDFLDSRKKVVLLDNNLTAAPWYHFEGVLKDLIRFKIKVDFSQGLDIRIIRDDHAQLLAKVKLLKQIHFAWDSLSMEQAVRKGIKTLSRHMPLSQLMFYVLIGYNTSPEEDLYRIEILRGLKVDPFVMPYDRSNQYQKRFARWVNHKAIFKSVAWADYR